jgi:hypothetical protein
MIQDGAGPQPRPQPRMSHPPHPAALLIGGPLLALLAAPLPCPAAEVPLRALYDTREDAEAAAPAFGCEGAHRMGSRWMPCAEHHDPESEP